MAEKTLKLGSRVREVPLRGAETPPPMSVERYFRAQLGENCCRDEADRAWLDRSIPVDSPCGADCKAAIDAAAALLTHVRAGFGNDRPNLAGAVIEAARQVVIVYAFG
jgi:hypothetical protein